MSSTYSEKYTTHLRAHSKILNGERTESPFKSKYVKLIKQFPEKKKSSSLSKNKFKQRRANSKPSTSKPNYNFKPKIKKKTKSKKKLENSEKFKQKQENECLNNEEENFNGNFSPIKNKDINNNNYMTKSTDFFKSDLKSPYFKKNNESNWFFYKTFQNDNFNKNITINKAFNGKDPFENYFEIFKLRKQASSVRDIIRNNYSKSKSNLKNQKTSTYFKAMKLKEEIQKSFKNINKPYTSNSNNRMINNEKNLLNEFINKSNNNINKSKRNIKKGNQNKNIYNNTYNDHSKENIINHFFDKSKKIPKKMKKYVNNSNPNINYKNINDNNFNNQQFKNQNKKNTFRKKANNSVDNNNYTLNNNINNFTNSVIFNKNNKNEILNYTKNFDYVNSINPEILKLNVLLKKIPSSTFKEKSYDLMNNIFKLQNHNVKNEVVYNMDDYNNSFHTIYPANEYNPLIKIKNSFK